MLVEAAFMFPIVILVTFGIIEYGLLFKDALTVDAGVRAGARVGITEARNPAYLADTENATKKALQNVVANADIKYLTIYKADPNTGNPTANGGFETCVTACSRFTFSGGNWVSDGGAGWDSQSMSACGGTGNTDYLGVYARVKHDYVTGLFGSQKQLKDHVVLRLEPIPIAQGCQ